MLIHFDIMLPFMTQIKKKDRTLLYLFLNRGIGPAIGVAPLMLANIFIYFWDDAIVWALDKKMSQREWSMHDLCIYIYDVMSNAKLEMGDEVQRRAQLECACKEYPASDATYGSEPGIKCPLAINLAKNDDHA